MKNYFLFTCCVIIVLILSCFIYVIKSERRIKELQQENLILKIDQEQKQIETENYKNLTQYLRQQIQKMKKLDGLNKDLKEKQKAKIQKMHTSEQIKFINEIFKNL